MKFCKPDKGASATFSAAGIKTEIVLAEARKGHLGVSASRPPEEVSECPSPYASDNHSTAIHGCMRNWRPQHSRFSASSLILAGDAIASFDLLDSARESRFWRRSKLPAQKHGVGQPCPPFVVASRPGGLRRRSDARRESLIASQPPSNLTLCREKVA